MDDEPINRPLAEDFDFLQHLDRLDDALEAKRPAFPAASRSILDLFPSRESADAPPPDVDVVTAPPAPTVASSPAEALPRLAPRRVERRRAPRGPAPPYATFYGFDEPPFAPVADPRFFFPSGAHDRLAQDLLTAIRRRDAIVAVLGEDGTGKTTVCRAVLEQLDRRTLTSFIADPIESFDDLLRTLLADLGVITDDDLARGTLASAGRLELLTTLREFLASLSPIGAFAVVFLDDAERVSIDMLQEIRVLADLDNDAQLLQLVFIGDPRFERKLRASELRPLATRVRLLSRLEPLRRDEVAPYLAHRIAAAGAHPRFDVTDEAAAALYRCSGGVPAVINAIADRAMERAHETAAPGLDRDVVIAAATELGIAAPSRGRRWLRVAAAVVVLGGLAITGAALAAYVYRDRVARAANAWIDTPAVASPPALKPAPPLPALPQNPPLTPNP